MLAVSGHLTAAVARAVVRSGADAVLALGVLHGARDADAELVKRARSGQPDALAALRRVHGPGAPGDAGHWSDEYSLDGFAAMLALAAKREGCAAPRIVARYPFLVGDDPSTLPGLDEVARVAERAGAIVATTDAVHHGTGYGTPERDRRSDRDDATHAWARDRIDAQLGALARGDFAHFQSLCADVRSDFRDDGPVLATLLRGRGSMRAEIHALDLVDYSEALAEPPPTWVAAMLASIAVA
jgi:hypothetical protein